MSQACNDKREVQPTLEAIQALPEVLGQVQSLMADNRVQPGQRTGQRTYALLGRLGPGKRPC